jgi:hypothetical protein
MSELGSAGWGRCVPRVRVEITAISLCIAALRHPDQPPLRRTGGGPARGWLAAPGSKACRRVGCWRGGRSGPGPDATGPRPGQAGQAPLVRLPTKLLLAGFGERFRDRGMHHLLVTCSRRPAARLSALARTTSGSRGPGGRASSQGRSRRALGRCIRMRFTVISSADRHLWAPVGGEPGCVWRLVLRETV